MMRFFLVNCVLSLIQMTFAIDVKCDTWTNKTPTDYICVGSNLETKRPGTIITEFNGTHLPGQNDSNVETFNIFNQKTDYLPRGLTTKYVNLNKLYVFKSGLKSIARDDFTEMPKLKTLILNENPFETIPSNCFDDLVLLELLIMRSNRIKTLPYHIFHALPNLKDITLSHNSIASIPAYLFEKNTQLLHVNFDHNQLKFIGSSILSNLTKLKTADFKFNICIDKNYPDTSINHLVHLFENNCNVIPVDICTSVNNDFVRLQELNKYIEAKKKAYNDERDTLRAICPNVFSSGMFATDPQSIESSQSYQQKYEELKKNCDRPSEVCNCEKSYSSQIEPELHEKE